MTEQNQELQPLPETETRLRRPARISPVSRPRSRVRRLFGDRAALRRAMLAREILGPPRGDPGSDHQ